MVDEKVLLGSILFAFVLFFAALCVWGAISDRRAGNRQREAFKREDQSVERIVKEFLRSQDTQ